MAVVWGLLAVVALCVFVTYSRVDPHELYHVSHDGLVGGASRVLVFLNYPTALVALAVLALVTDRLDATRPALLALALCLVILVPGVVDQNDLDAKWINVLPALGVAIVAAMTIQTIRTGGLGGAGESRGDRTRIGVAAVLGFVALPWIFAELGVYIGDVPLLDHVFRSKQVYQGHAAVHLGEHHGLEGLLLVVTALLLTRELVRMRPGGLRTALALYLSLLIPYGVGNMANDGWKEQVFERGWTSWTVPDVLRPDLSWSWAVILLAGVLIYVLVWRDSESPA